MQRVNELDVTLSQIFSNFSTIAASLNFNEICELADERLISEQRYPGVYKIDMHSGNDHDSFSSWSTWFQGEWVTDEYERMHVPNPKKKRLAAHMHKPLQEWVPIYIGKSKDIAGRVLGHIHLRLKQPTTGLKLRERHNMSSHRFRLSTLHLNVANYDLIVPQLERAFRDIHNPILGRQ